MAMVADNGGPQHVALGPSRQFTVQDLAAVAAGQATLELEKSALEKLPPSNLSRTTTVVPSVKPRGAELGPIASRAVIVARLVSLMQGRSAVGRDVAELLAALLNRGVAPLLHVESAGAELAGLVMGGPVMATFLDAGAAGEAADVFERLGMVPLQSLAEEEAKALSEGSFARTGPGALEAGAISSLVTTADAIAAVSCEAVKASTEPFSEKLWDQRPHRGQMTSAANLRLLLSNSGLANATATGGEASYEFTSIPQIHGPCRETIEAGVKSMELELNVAEKADETPFHPAQVEVVLANMQNAARAFARASAGRLSVLRKAKTEAADRGAPQQDGSAVVTAAEVRQALAAEASEALSQLRALSEAAEAATKAKEEKAKPVGPERGGGKPEEPLEEMDPAKRAKIEAARKAKAEKAAAKAAAKAAKSGRSVVLGQGTREVKDWIEARTGGSVDVSAVADAINPLATGTASLSAFVLRLLERLGSGGAQRKPKIVKGARDFNGEEMLVREEAFGIIRSIFKVHGAHEIDTPVFELKETLTGKYGEDSKLIYDLADQGGELLSLRYDLTVPFARYLAINNTINLKRYHIAKVYRRDNPAMNRGRFREFYQCDFDIAGSYPLMVPDAEVITVAVEILTALPIGTFEIKLNHRRLLDSIFEICGVPSEKFRTICSAVDKLDKEPWSEVKREMTEEKGLKPEVADRIGEFVCLRGAPRQLLSRLESDKMFGDHEGATAALKELDVLFGYLEALGSLDYVVFDMSLARGLDYYTGVIYEAVLTHNESQVGSIAAGGRYDNLVGMFSGQPTPCVGVSVGVERVLTIMADQRQKKQQDRNPFVEVLVMSIGKGMLPHRMRLARALWQAGISAEYLPQENPTLKRQMEHAHESRIPFLVIVGADEIEQGVVKVKDPSKPQGESEETVPESEMVQSLMSKGCRVVGRRRVGPSSPAAEEVRGADSV